MWPGLTKSSGVLFGFAKSLIVVARSFAEMPVPTPCFGLPSTLIVNGVPRTEVFVETCGCRSSRSQSALAMATQR